MGNGEVTAGKWLLTAPIDVAKASEPAIARGYGMTRSEAPIVHLNLWSHVNTWVLCFILLVFASVYGFSFERGIENTSTGSKEAGISADSSQEHVVIRIQNAGTYLLCALVMLPLAGSIGVEFRRNALVTALLLWALLSCFWSVDVTVSAINGLRMVLSVALAFYLYKRYAPNDLLKLLMLVGSVAAVGSLLVILVVPQYGLQSRDALYAFGAWQGIFGHKNICGRMMTLLLLPAFFVQLHGRLSKPIRYSYVVVLLVVIAMTRSAGSWVLCSTCLVFIGMSRLIRQLRWKDALGVGMVVLGSAAVAIVGAVANADVLLRMIGKDPTMTGRTMIWASLLVSALKHPFIGYGYLAFWQGLAGESGNAILQLNWPGMGYAENGVLELGLELGGIGVFLYAVVFFEALKNAVYCFRQDASPSTMWYMSVLFYVASANLWAGNLFAPSTLECVIPIVAFAGLGEVSRRTRSLRALRV